MISPLLHFPLSSDGDCLRNGNGSALAHFRGMPEEATEIAAFFRDAGNNYAALVELLRAILADKGTRIKTQHLAELTRLMGEAK